MKLKTSHVILGSLAAIAISQGDRVGDAVSKNQQIRSERAEFADLIRENKAELRQAEKLSKIALERYRNNCVLVADATTGREALFQPGEPVIEPHQKDRTLRPGLFICNRMGDTGVVSEAGTIADIARVTTPDLPEFKKLLGGR